MSTGVLIDHTAHPYIVDLVMSHGDMGSMLNWRLTSRSFRARVDNILFHHVTFKAPQTLTNTTDVADVSLHPGSMSLAPPVANTKSLPFAPQAVKILDICYKTTDLARLQLTSVHTLRRMNLFVFKRWSNQVPSATTVVDFFNSAKVLVTRRYPRAPGKTWVFLPACAHRYVLHVEWFESLSGSFNTTLDFKNANNLCEWVLILHPCIDAGGAPHHESFPPFVGQIITHMIKVLERKGSITIVGSEGVNPVQFGGRPNDSSTDLLRATVAKLIDQEFPEGPARDHAHSHTSFVTLAGWFDALGDKREIEGIWVDKRWQQEVCPACVLSVSLLDKRSLAHVPSSRRPATPEHAPVVAVLATTPMGYQGCEQGQEGARDAHRRAILACGIGT